ncbi:MAG: cupin domain-containing protein [Deltaproteobacteria bacterium]|nr:cupin domain-containing protein [Deltaproteobacteria bacterium]
MTEEQQLRELDERLRKLSVDGLWSQPSEADKATYSKDPHTTVLPHVWKWPEMYDAIQTVANMHGLDGKAERRVLRLINPAYLNNTNRRQRTTTHTMLMTLQLLKPGEIAHDHRHNFAAFRFILKGSGAYTVVEGEKIPMEAGDLILTPSMTWHGHRNGNEAVVWLDGLDNPLLFLLQSITWEAHSDRMQPMKNEAEHTAPRLGMTRATWEATNDRPSYNLHYKWSDTYANLKRLSAGPCSPYDGVSLEYVNPEGGHTMPTMSCGIQMLRPGEVTKTHRHNYSTVYHAFRGNGTMIVNGEKFEWEQGDCFVLPLWAWHSHQNRSKSDDAILFSVSDRPVMEALKLFREEPGEG